MIDEYLRARRLWKLVGDCYAGTEAIKNGGDAKLYLPPRPFESEEIRKAVIPFERNAYGLRRHAATYENFFKPTIDDIVGLMQKNKPTVRFGVADDAESPVEVRDMASWGNRFNDGLCGLKQRLNFGQVLHGRYGLLLDVVADENGLEPAFRTTEYPAPQILDGEELESSSGAERSKLRWVLLDESTRRFRPETKTWSAWRRLRLLGLDGANRYYNAIFEGFDASSVRGAWREFDLDNPTESSGSGFAATRVVYPTFKGRTLDFVPFTCCNVDRLGLDVWQDPPYLDVACVAVGNYVVDSWYKTALFHCATPTLVVCNAARESEGLRLGGTIWTKSAANHPVNVSLLETSGSGIAEMRAAKEELKASLRYSSIRDLLDGAGANSSSDAIRLRTESGTAAIAAADRAGARAIEEQLCFASLWAGASRDETRDRISFEADVSYLGTEVRLESVVAFLSTNAQVGILSNANVYALLQKSVPGVFSSFEDNEAQKTLDEEAAREAGLGAAFGASGELDDEDDEDDEPNEDDAASTGKEDKSDDEDEAEKEK